MLMGKDFRKLSIFISLLIHGVVLAIPFTFSVKNFSNEEIEIYILDERPIPHTSKIEEKREVKKNLEEKKVVDKPMLTQKLEEQKLQSQLEVKKEEKEPSESKFIEPVEIKEKEEGKILVEPKHAQATSPANTSSSNVAAIGLPRGEEKGERRIIEEVEFGSAQGPRFLHREIPQYPLIARRLGKEGIVKLKLTIDENGKLLNIEVLEGAGYGFTEAAIEAVKKSTFIPAYKNGKPVMSKALLTIRFTLRRDQ
ncbi:MAG: TonB family protein [Caldimicrobium sp.]